MSNTNEINNFFEKNSNEFSKNDVLFGLMELLKVKTILDYSDLRSTVNWCKKNKVFIIKQGNKKYVNKWEFILSFHKQFIMHLKEKHKNWKEIFIAHIKGNLNELVDSPEEKLEAEIISSYKPKTDTEISFMSKIKKL